MSGFVPQERHRRRDTAEQCHEEWGVCAERNTSGNRVIW